MKRPRHQKKFALWRNWFLPGFVAMMLAAPGPSFALDPSKSIYQYNCRSWTRQNGLPANAVSAITQTKDGYVWLGTSAGLVRFDGGEFKLYDVSHATNSRSSLITSLSLSRRGGMWFGMENGSFGLFDEKNISILGSDKYGGVNMNVHKVMETEDGTVWLASESAAARLTSSNNFELVLNTTSLTERYDVAALFQDSKQRVWMGTVQRGLYYWQQGVLKKFPDPIVDSLTINCLAEDREGQIWIGTDSGLLCYDTNMQRKAFPFPWYATRALLVDKRGTLWAGTSGGGVIRFDKGTPVGLQQKDGLADDFVTSLAEDDEGSLWAGTRNGLSQISDVKLPTFGKAEGLTASVNVAVSASRSNGLWVATSEGFTYFDGVARAYTNIGLSNSYVIEVCEAANHDLYVVDGSMNVNVITDGRIMATYPNKVWPSALVEDAEGMIAVIGGNYFRVGTNFFKPYKFVNDQPPPMGWVFNMTLAHDGSVWVAADQGVCRIKGDAWQMWTAEQGLAKSKVKWVCEDAEGVVWAGQETGLSRIKDGKARVITRDDGLFDNIINGIVPDDHGNLWIDSSRGFFRVSRQSLNDFADGKASRVRCEGFNGLDDVKSSEKYQQQVSGCKTPDGRIWFPTAQGIVMIDPTNMVDNRVLPKVYIQSVRANGSELDEFRSAVVPPGSGRLEFHYAGVSYLEPLKIQYRYELEGYDKDWVEAGNRRAAFYTNLKPGAYTFKVQTRYEDGEWNVAGAEAALMLLPQFYQKFWFVALVVVSVVTGIFGIYVWRVRHFRWSQRKLQEAHNQLETKVKERTSELARTNTSLKDEIEERKRMQQEIEDVHQQLLDTSRQAGMAEVATNVLHNVGNVLNSVNVSTSVVMSSVKKSKVSSLAKIVALLREHESDLGTFLTQDARGKQLPDYLHQLSTHLLADQTATLEELESLRVNIEHIKEIVAMQQNYAKVSGVKEIVNVRDLVEDSLRMNLGSLERHGVELVRDFKDLPPMNIEKHKVLQILVNLVRNAKHACDASGRADKQMTVRVADGDGRVRISVIDNGVGIPPENLNRIFNHGFTTKKDGHGFGLHSGALAAKEMGGSLSVQSEGPGTGATFILELPFGKTGHETRH